MIMFNCASVMRLILKQEELGKVEVETRQRKQSGGRGAGCGC